LKNKDTDKLHCDFCSESQDDVELLIAGPNGIAICNRCTGKCNEIILQALKTQQVVKPFNQQEKN